MAESRGRAPSPFAPCCLLQPKMHSVIARQDCDSLHRRVSDASPKFTGLAEVKALCRKAWRLSPRTAAGGYQYCRPFAQSKVLLMRIAQIAPLFERVPPKLYGGTERIVSYLTEELVHQGHDVTLFASGDSKTSAKLVPCCDIALRLNPSVRDALPYHVIMLEQIRRRVDEFDLLHFHIDFLHASLIG